MNQTHHNRSKDYKATTDDSPSLPSYKVGGLDFERVINQYSIQAIRDKFHQTSYSGNTNRLQNSLSFRRNTKQRTWLLGFTGRTATRWVLTIIASLLTGLTSIGLVVCTSSMVSYRSSILHSAVNNWDHSENDKSVVFQSYLLTNLSLALMSSLLCVYFAPHAAGSGIPEVKAYLNGVRSMHKLASVRLFLVKVLGTILSVSSGLSVGQEGPLIHIGAIMGASCTKFGGFLENILIHWNARRGGQIRKQSWSERLARWTMQELSRFATDAERRDLVSIGASVGFAASFGAPVGGLLFILDDISCYFERRLLLRSRNAIGTFCLAVKHKDFSFGIINLGEFSLDEIFETRTLETPLYILIGLGGGVLGGFFCAAYLWLRQNITSKFPPARAGRVKCQLLEIAVVSILTSAVLFYLPTVSWACKPIPNDLPASVQADYEMQESKRFFCEKGHINEMANVMFGSRVTAIKDILADPTAYQQRTLLAVGGVFYFLTLITFGTLLPSGLFTPTILVGASLGGAAGNFFHQYVDEDIHPSTFALLGVASMLAGIQRSTVSVAVILVEGTGQIKVLLPVIIVVAIARSVAKSVEDLGIFEAAIHYKQLPYLYHEQIPQYFDAVTVKDILSEAPVLCLEAREKVGDLIDVLNKSAYQSFPVVESGSNRFLGLVKRTQIAALLECGVFTDSKSAGCDENLCSIGNLGNEEALTHWAYCINDDRYAHILSLPEEELVQGNSTRSKQQDEDEATGESRPLLTKEQKDINTSMRMSLRRQSTSVLYPEFCDVGRNESGSIVVSWMKSEYNEYWVDLSAVANNGTYTVTEFCPVSKAYAMFTSLGLSHIVVLSTTCEVVGVLSRASFLPKHIEESSNL